MREGKEGGERGRGKREGEEGGERGRGKREGKRERVIREVRECCMTHSERGGG